MQDLDEIWDYTASHWGKDQANGYVSEIRQLIESLVQTSSLHPDADHLYPHLRKARAGTHFVYFLKTGDVEVIRILHVRRHASPLLYANQ